MSDTECLHALAAEARSPISETLSMVLEHPLFADIPAHRKHKALCRASDERTRLLFLFDEAMRSRVDLTGGRS